MSVKLFRDRLAKSRLHPYDIKWMPSWVAEFANDTIPSNCMKPLGKGTADQNV
jgi:hypothetical protein